MAVIKNRQPRSQDEMATVLGAMGSGSRDKTKAATMPTPTDSRRRGRDLKERRRDCGVKRSTQSLRWMRTSA